MASSVPSIFISPEFTKLVRSGPFPLGYSSVRGTISHVSKQGFRYGCVSGKRMKDSLCRPENKRMTRIYMYGKRFRAFQKKVLKALQRYSTAMLME